MKRNQILPFLLLLTAESFLFSCTKDKSETTTQNITPFELRMTDATAPYDAVYLDVQGVEVKTDNGASVLLNVNPGIYNLLDYANGNDTLIAVGNIPTSTVSQVRLILGSNNSVLIDSVSYPLNTPSAQESGLKLQVHTALQPGVVYRMLIDFDANRSIVLTGNGTYQLKPVIRVVTQAASGAIHGTVAPALALPAAVLAVNGSDTLSTTTDASGHFLFQGLTAGTYSVTIIPQPPYMTQTITGVSVTTGTLTEVPAVTVIL
jgi:hypothetical protein